MNPTSNSANTLKKLITQSRSFSEKEKKQLLERLPSLSQEKMTEAISVLKKEQAFWTDFDKRDEKDLASFKQFIVKTKRERQEMAKTMLKQSEDEESRMENVDADNLIKSL